MSTVLEDSQRYLRALDGATDPMAHILLNRVTQTLERAVRPLSGRDVRTRTPGDDNAIQGALRALWDAGLVIGTPRRGPGGGTVYVLPRNHHYSTHLGDRPMTHNNRPTAPLIEFGKIYTDVTGHPDMVRVDVHRPFGGERVYYLPELDVVLTEDEAEHRPGFDELVARAKTTPVQSITFNYVY